MKNKRGQLLLPFLLVILALVVMLFFLSNLEGGGALVANAPDSVANALKVTARILEPIVKGLFWLVTPAGENENVQVIAFSIFLLLWLVGSQTLRLFLGYSLSFFVSGIVGIIAGRSLTATVLKETALGASPIATASFLLGFFPILIVKGMLDRWFYRHLDWTSEDKSGNIWGIPFSAESAKIMLIRFAVWLLLAFSYYFVYKLPSFNVPTLGLVYSVCICIFAIGDVIFPIIDQKRRALEAEETGKFIGFAGRLKKFWSGAQTSAARNQRILGNS